MRIVLVSMGLLAACDGGKITSGETGVLPYETGNPGGDGDSGGTGGGGDDTVESAAPAACPTGSYPGRDLTDDAICLPTVAPAWELVERWTVTYPYEVLATTPAVAPMDDDDGDGVVTEADNADLVIVPCSAYIGQTVRSLDATDGSERWAVGLTIWEQSGAAIGDLDRDGWPEVVMAGYFGDYALSGEDGAEEWVAASSDMGETIRGQTGLADLDGDGDVEVIYGPVALYYGSGGAFFYGEFNPSVYMAKGQMSTAIDLDGDGIDEMVYGAAAWRMDGSQLWVGAEDPSGQNAIADLNNDGHPEVVVAHPDRVAAYEADGSLLWETDLRMPTEYNSLSAPAIADFDGDGGPEVAVGLPGAVAVLDEDGTVLWNNEVDSVIYPDVVTDGVVAADLDSDGVFEVVHQAWDGIHIWDGLTGAPLASYTTDEAGIIGQLPIVVDSDHDGHVEIIFNATEIKTSDSWIVSIEDSAGFGPGLSVWNQDGWSIDNINDDLTIPEEPTPSWTTHNSFRAAPRWQDVIADRDLTVEISSVCQEECERGTVVLWVALGNTGTAEQPAGATIHFTGWGAGGAVDLGSTVWPAPVPGLRVSDAVEVRLEVPDTLYSITATVAGDEDCDADNDAATWEDVICP